MQNIHTQEVTSQLKQNHHFYTFYILWKKIELSYHIHTTVKTVKSLPYNIYTQEAMNSVCIVLKFMNQFSY